MLSAPSSPLPHRSQLGAPSLSASSSLCAADALESRMEDEEEGISNNVFASLMPNLFSRLKHCDDTVSEQEFQKIHQLLNLARSEDDVIKGNPFINQPSDQKAQEEVQNTPGLLADGMKAQEEAKTNFFSLIKLDHANGKENASPNDPPKRNKLSRRERSSRITTHHKPFVVDVRSFGSLLNNNALGKCQKPQDVHAFWEASDEQEASEAIMDKLRGRCEQKAGSGTTSLRRLGVRRKNSQRITTRLKCFAVELPSCAQQALSLDQEQLEEEDATEESSFTFLSNPEFRILNQPFEQKGQKGANKGIEGSCLLSPLQSIKKAIDSIYLDGLSNQPKEDLDVLSDGKSPTINETDIGQSSANMPAITAFKWEAPEPECNKQSVPFQMVDIARSEGAAFFVGSHAASNEDKNAAENNDDGSVKATPYNRNTAAKKTPFTSPTPPSNPLAAFGLRKDTVVEDMSKRRLDFDDTIGGLPAPDINSPAPVPHNISCLQTFSISPGSSETLAEEEIVVSAKKSIIEAPVSLGATASSEQISNNPPKSTLKRKKLVNNRRNSLEGAGTSWDEGHRRSTRIKSRPLEWWRGERFLLGRVHKSLATVIGIKYSSPPPCWPKRGTKAPKFKVESYVSEDYAKYVQFAALC